MDPRLIRLLGNWASRLIGPNFPGHNPMLNSPLNWAKFFHVF